MLNKACLVIVSALTVLPQMGFAADNLTSRCVDISVPKGAIAARNGKWIELTPEQWQFLRGIYAMNPETPAGLATRPCWRRSKAIRAASFSSSMATKPARQCPFRTSCWP